MKTIARQMFLWGPRGVSIFALLVACFALFIVYTRPVPLIPPNADTVKIVPATGEQGFDAKTFCEDPLTSVSKVIAPDASGATYELKRLKNSVSETVVLTLAQTGDVLYAKHFWDTPTGQQSEPAFVDDDVKRCVERKS